LLQLPESLGMSYPVPEITSPHNFTTPYHHQNYIPNFGHPMHIVTSNLLHPEGWNLFQQTSNQSMPQPLLPQQSWTLSTAQQSQPDKLILQPIQQNIKASGEGSSHGLKPDNEEKC
jgi:hypothetical protein